MIEFILYTIIASIVFACYLLIGYRFFRWSYFMTNKNNESKVVVYIAGCVISGFWPITVPVIFVIATLTLPFYWVAKFVKKIAIKYNW